jgi:hypothetical protein
MNIVRMILKEAGGRIENAAGSIKSGDNMFEGSSGNAVSDKVPMLGGGGNNNPVSGESSETTAEETPEVEVSETTDASETFSDEKLKDEKMSSLRGKLRNLDLNPLSMKSTTSNSSGGANFSAMQNMFSGIMGADSGADASDMGDMADAASDSRLKNIFGDNEDIIKTFGKINAIQFTYNDKAKEIPGGENKGIDDDLHLGVKAQELAENPLTASAVSRDPNSGYLQIDTKELTTANSAVISELCKRIEILEKILGVKVV